MARNGSGSMSILSSFVNGDTADAEVVMNDLNDIASEISNSLALDGQSTMTGVVKLATGSVSSPALQWGADSNTGLYRISGDTFGATCGGVLQVTFSTSGLSLTTPLAVTQGGTGAATAAAAATALGLGTGDSPQFTAVNIGAATDTTVTRTGAGALAVEGNAIFTAGNAATQAQMETATSLVVPVTPGRQHFHPGMVKAWASVGNNGATALGQTYNVTSATRNGAGDVTVTFTDALSGVGYAAIITMKTTTVGNVAQTASIIDKQTTSVRVSTANATSSGDSTMVATDHDFSILVLGDI